MLTLIIPNDVYDDMQQASLFKACCVFRLEKMSSGITKWMYFEASSDASNLLAWLALYLTFSQLMIFMHSIIMCEISRQKVILNKIVINKLLA